MEMINLKAGVFDSAEKAGERNVINVGLTFGIRLADHRAVNTPKAKKIEIVWAREKQCPSWLKGPVQLL